ncbi:MAG TPA: rod-binding protein [Terricaulis sp.]|nr:rod-binding protein [Terricaulis sp.]
MDGPALVPLLGAPLPTARTTPDATQDEIRRVAQEFESVFLAEMLSPMFEALDTEGLGGGGIGEQMFRPMLVQRYAESIARNGGVGVADYIIAELNRMQVVETAPTETPDGAAR